MKAQLFSMAQRGEKKGSKGTPFSDSAVALKPGSVTDDYMKKLLDATEQVSGAPSPSTTVGREPCTKAARPR